MRHLNTSLLVVGAALVTVVQLACTGPESNIKTGCVAAYNASYSCWGREDAFNALERESNELTNCDEFVRTMADGAYWIEKVGSTGDTTVSLSIVGENGWLACGTRSWSDEHGNSFFDECACRLDSIASDSILVGECVKYNMVMMSTTVGSFKNCLEDKCVFTIPVHRNAIDAMTGLSCIDYFHRDSEIRDSIAADSSVYQIAISDDEIALRILDVTATWTKRPGL